MHEYRSLALIILSIFAVTLIGAYFSPTFTEQRTYLELFMAFGSLLFIFSILVIFATLGFHSFSIYMSVVIAIVIAMFGIVGALVIVLAIYIAWGSVFAMEVLLFDAGAKSAQEWFVERYSFKEFKAEFYAFYPMIGFIFLILEIIPNIFNRESVIDFSPSRVLHAMKELLP